MTKVATERVMEKETKAGMRTLMGDVSEVLPKRGIVVASVSVMLVPSILLRQAKESERPRSA